MNAPLMMFVRCVAMVALTLAGAGCSGGSISGLTPSPPPTYEGIAKEYKEFTDRWNSARQGRTISDDQLAVRYVAHGYDLADRACLQYFTRLRELRNRNNFTSNTLSAIFAAGGVVAGLSGVASPILVGLFAAGGLVPSTVESFNNIYLLAEVGDDLYPKIYEAMAKFRAESPADGSGKVAIDRWNAEMLVQQYAALCSVPFMTAAVNQGVSSLDIQPNANGVIEIKKKKN